MTPFKKKTGWWFKRFFYVHPELWGKWTQFDEHIFSNGLVKNHQPESNLDASFFQSIRTGRSNALSRQILLSWWRELGLHLGSGKREIYPSICQETGVKHVEIMFWCLGKLQVLVDKDMYTNVYLYIYIHIRNVYIYICVCFTFFWGLPNLMRCWCLGIDIHFRLRFFSERGEGQVATTCR